MKITRLLFVCALTACSANGDIDGGTDGDAIELCGNDVIDPDEACDGIDLGAQTCATAGFLAGTLGCSSDCSELDVTACSPRCGNGLIESLEDCEGVDLSGQTCQTLAFDGGDFACTGECTFDTTTCTGAGPVCGDGSVDGAEDCEPGASVSSTCQELGFDGGEVGCGDDCELNTNACTVCGDETRQGDETCDGSDAGSVSCESRGFTGGTTTCSADCNVIEFTECTGTPVQECGNGELEGNERCDVGQLEGNDCTTLDLGFTEGTLDCNSTCSDWDLSACVRVPACGDGFLDLGELCDSGNVGTTACGDIGWFSGGNLTCSADCSSYDVSACDPAVDCGNGVIDGNELCDGDATTPRMQPLCELAGLGVGVITCSANCAPDYSGCTESDLCGGDDDRYNNNICDACDVFGGEPDPECSLCGLADNWCPDYFDPWANVWTCRRLGRPDPDCGCGDGDAVFEWCDGEDFIGQTCDSFGYQGGELTCGNCRVGFSACTRCGADSDCSEPGLGVCDPNSGICAECGANPDCAANEICLNGDCTGQLPIGSACTANTDCESLACTGWPGGYCTSGCDADTDCPGGSHCVAFNSASFCIEDCAVDTDCGRYPDFVCRDSDGVGSLECGPTAAGPGDIGEACTDQFDCGGGDYGECFGWEAGYCSLSYCADFSDCPAGSHCGFTNGGGIGYCLEDCISSADCGRADYTCKNADADINNLPECAPSASGTGAVGDACESTADCAGAEDGNCSRTFDHPEGYCFIGPCSNDSDCPAGSHCGFISTTSGTGTCYADCQSDADCRPSSYGCYDSDFDGQLECNSIGDGPNLTGEPCADIRDCAGGEYARCFSWAAFPDYGYCSVYCGDGLGDSVCPGPDDFCGDADILPYCVDGCTSDADCRPGLVCSDLGLVGGDVCWNP